MNLLRVTLSSLGACAYMLSTSAHAGLVTFSNIQGLWFNGDPAANISCNTGLSSNAQVRWGGGPPCTADSGYNFVASGTTSVTVPPPQGFIVGQFSHVNLPINAGTSITGIDLEIDANVSIDNVAQGTKKFFFHFIHDETTNNLDPDCPFGVGTGVNANGCADKVSVNFLNSSDTFLVGTDVYTININGFQQGNGPLVHDFLTMENATSTANLVASVTLRSSIPEPGTMALASLALLGLTLSRRRRL